MNASAAALLNAVKHLGRLDAELHLISPLILEPIQKLKTEALGGVHPTLTCEEILIALSICAATNPSAQLAIDKLPELRGTQAHCTTMLSLSDEKIFQKLAIDITSDQEFATDNLFYSI